MTRTGRGLLGALLGALLTLSLHPVSRPYMIGLSSRIPPAMLRECVDSYAKTVPEPKNLVEASLWMQLAAKRIYEFDKLSDKEWKTLMQIAVEGQQHDVTNAFWPQMKAILYEDRGSSKLAEHAWIDASHCVKWDDYQTRRLLQARDRLADITGVKESWQLALLYYARSDDVAMCLERLVKHQLSDAPDDTPSGLELRYATLLNGDLLRHYAHSTKTNVEAMNIVELAAYQPALVPLIGTVSPKRLWAGENTIVVNLEKILRQPEYSRRARKIFSNAESWRALTIRDTNESDAAKYSSTSVVALSLASAALALAAIGTLIWLVGNFVEWRLARSKEIKWYVAVALAIVLGAAVYVLTGYLPASFVIALCAAFLTVAPDRSRKTRPTDLGPLFSLMAVLLGILCSVMLGIYFVISTPEAVMILPNVGVPSEYLDKPVLAGLASVTFGLVMLIAPFWAIAHRVGTPYVLGLILTKFGAFISVASLTLGVILGPMCVYVDRQIDGTLFQLLTNEPLHYYVHP